MLDLRRKDLESQGYRLIGRHSGIKICLWCKKSLKEEDVCYKNKFYGIESWRCIQASVSLDSCNLKCSWCWRDVNVSNSLSKIDAPNEIVEGFIEEHKKILMGFKGSVDEKRFREAMNPKHIALSLNGESCLYPKLVELIDDIASRRLTSFLVSNGTFPGMIKNLIKSNLTQIYITLPAPDKETFIRVCNADEGLWEKVLESLSLLENFERSVIRLTLVKNVNIIKPEKYAEIFNKYKFNYLELKSAMNVGHAKSRLDYKEVLSFEDIKEFGRKISELTNLKIIDEKKESRVVLMAEKDYSDRKLNIN